MPATALTRRFDQQAYAASSGMATQDWRALGTSAQLVVTDPSALSTAREAVEAVLRDIDLAASRFRDDSEISTINSGEGRWEPISPLLTRALRIAIDAAAWTDGLVDPTVGAALVDLGYDRTFTLISSQATPAPIRVRTVPGWRSIELDETNRRVRVPAGTQLDLGATAKGLAADLASEAAAQAARCGVLVSLGGDISVAGPAPGGGWPVTVGDTANLDVRVGAELEQRVSISGGGLATSSIRARRWRRGGSELHHLLDPRTGLPATAPYRTVSVAANTCTLANAASTAAIIAGPDAPAWLSARGLPARLVARNGEVLTLAGWPSP